MYHAICFLSISLSARSQVHPKKYTHKCVYLSHLDAFKQKKHKLFQSRLKMYSNTDLHHRINVNIMCVYTTYVLQSNSKAIFISTVVHYTHTHTHIHIRRCQHFIFIMYVMRNAYFMCLFTKHDEH